MSNSLLVGLNVPSDFDIDRYISVNVQVAIVANPNDSDNPGKRNSWHSYASAWNGVAYRLINAVESHEEFEKSISKSTAPGGQENYIQERALFSCIVSALSSIECFFMAAFSIGTALKPEYFQLDEAKNLNKIPCKVANCFSKWESTAIFSKLLKEIVESSNFKELNDLRNYLAHRGILPRKHYLSNGLKDIPSAVPTKPKELPLDFDYSNHLSDKTTYIHIEWLISTLNKLIQELDEFLKSKVEAD